MPLMILEPGALNLRPRGLTGPPGPAGAPGDGLSFDSLADALATTIDADVHAFRTFGYAWRGDGGHDVYVESASEPTDPRKGQELGGRWFMSAGVDTVCARTLGVKANDIDWDTEAWAKVELAGRNRRIIMPAGVSKVTSTSGNGAITFHKDFNYILDGQGRDPLAAGGTVINNVGTGSTIKIDAAGVGDKTIELRNFMINGNPASLDGINLVQAGGARLRGLWIVNCGRYGIFGTQCYSAICEDLYVSHNGAHGIYFNEQANNLKIADCRSIANSRYNAGFANIAVTGATNLENLSPSIERCDFSGPGASNASASSPGFIAYGMLLTHCWTPTVRGGYAEVAPDDAYLFYADATNEGLNIAGVYFQDGQVLFEAPPKAVIGVNTLNAATRATHMQINTAGGEGIRYLPQILKNGATFTPVGAGVTLL